MKRFLISLVLCFLPLHSQAHNCSKEQISFLERDYKKALDYASKQGRRYKSLCQKGDFEEKMRKDVQISNAVEQWLSVCEEREKDPKTVQALRNYNETSTEFDRILDSDEAKKMIRDAYEANQALDSAIKNKEPEDTIRSLRQNKRNFIRVYVDFTNPHDLTKRHSKNLLSVKEACRNTKDSKVIAAYRGIPQCYHYNESFDKAATAAAEARLNRNLCSDGSEQTPTGPDIEGKEEALSIQ